MVLLGIVSTPRWKALAWTPIVAACVLAILYQGHLELFAEGLRTHLLRHAGGHESYLLGRISQTGWWYYFPVAFTMKWPIAVLALAGCALGTWFWKRPKPGFPVLAVLIPRSTC